MKEFDAEALRDLNQRMLKASLRASRIRIFSVVFMVLAVGSGYVYLQHKESEATGVILARQSKLEQDSLKNVRAAQAYHAHADSLVLEDSIRHFVKEYLACREKHDAVLLSSYHSDTLRQYFRYAGITRAKAEALGVDYWKKNPRDKFLPQLEPVLHADGEHYIALITGEQCRMPPRCLPEILEIHVRVGGTRLTVDYIRAFYADGHRLALHRLP